MGKSPEADRKQQVPLAGHSRLTLQVYQVKTQHCYEEQMEPET